MAKTKDQMITDWREIIGQTDSSNSQFTDAQGLIWANDAYRKIATRLAARGRGGLPVTKRDYTPSAQEVTLNSATLKIKSIRYKVQPADKFENMEVLSLEEFIDRYPDWENDPTGIPHTIVRTGTFKIQLYPSPNAANLNQTLRTYVIESPAALTASNTTPDLPEPTHDLFAHYMAYKAFSAMEKKEDATQELIMFRGGLKDMAGVVGNYTTKLKQFRWTETEPGQTYD